MRSRSDGFLKDHVTLNTQIKIKSLLLSHHHSTSALVSEILMSVLQTVQKKKKNVHMDSTYLQNTRVMVAEKSALPSHKNIAFEKNFHLICLLIH